MRFNLNRRSLLSSLGLGGLGLVGHALTADQALAETGESRSTQALKVRTEAAKVALRRGPVAHLANGDELLYRFPMDASLEARQGQPSHLTGFTKGLPHSPFDGLVRDPAHFQLFVKATDSGDLQDFKDTPLGPEPNGVSPGQIFRDANFQAQPEIPWLSAYTKAQRGTSQQQPPMSDAEQNKCGKVGVRGWESQSAGLTFDLEGPDAQAVTMPPAPTLDSQEFLAEVAEVYEMALLRDVPFANFDSDPKVKATVDRLNDLEWFKLKGKLTASDLTPEAQARRRPGVTQGNLFRGIFKGDLVGPYLSQFLCRGTAELGDPSCLKSQPTPAGFALGVVQYGSIFFRNRVRRATPCVDYMTTYRWWLDVQNGADLRRTESYVEGADLESRYTFIATPRDLATYVHYDALYEAYLNACLAMLALGLPFDPGLPFLSDDSSDHQDNFVNFGGPHILSLVTEVATRALKAVRFQKFNVHRRLRPEAIAGRIHRYMTACGESMDCKETASRLAKNLHPVAPLAESLGDLLDQIKAHNALQNQDPDTAASPESPCGKIQDSRYRDLIDDPNLPPNTADPDVYLLPMAFAEGSPMHPAYGAGHATVAGACVTILKAFFDAGAILPCPYYQPAAGGETLEIVDVMEEGKPIGLTVEGELNKLAANISIGRNWAGVHYFTDYYESVLLGEEIAIGLLEEQKLTFGENFSMSLPKFNGQTIRI